MANITIKDIPDELYDRLKEMAKLHRRSINSEVIVCIEDAILPRRNDVEGTLKRTRRLRTLTAGHPVSDAELTAAKNLGRP